jgi:hypothetical protein
LFRQLKPVHKLAEDPDLTLRMGRLIGAAEMAGHILTQTTDPNYKHVGEQLAFVADWFFEPTTKSKGL